MTHSDNKIARRIAYFIKQRKITQQEFLDLLLDKYGIEISQPTISNWKNGVSSPSIELAPVFCEIFDVSFNEFFGNISEWKLPEEMKYLSEQFNADPEKAFQELTEKYEQLLIENQMEKSEKEKLKQRLDAILEQFKNYEK